MQKYSLYIPSSLEKSSYFVEQVQNSLTRLVGGTSTFDIVGTWQNAYRVVVTEPITVVTTLAHSWQSEQVRDLLKTWAETIKRELDQESVLLTVESVPEVHFI